MSMMMEQPRNAMYAAPPPAAYPAANHTTVVLNQPQSSAHTPHRMQMQQRDWNSGICSCFDDCLSCFLSICFPCCFSCFIACRLDENCFTPICVPGGETAMRTKLRTMNGIQGSICNDCFTLYFCYPCALAQMAREIKATQGTRVV